MDTFKQFMGFVLLGTVVFLLHSIQQDYFIPTFALLIGIWAACWWVGRMPITLSPGRRLLGWLEGAVVTAVIGSFAFTWLVPHPNVLPWQPFSRATLAQLTGQGKTVLVDFTASWCLTCQCQFENRHRHRGRPSAGRSQRRRAAVGRLERSEEIADDTRPT